MAIATKNVSYAIILLANNVEVLIKDPHVFITFTIKNWIQPTFSLKVNFNIPYFIDLIIRQTQLMLRFNI